MCTFIEDYLSSPSVAIRKAQTESQSRLDDIDDETVYAQLASPEYRLYEAIIFSVSDDVVLQVNPKRLSS